MKIKTKTAAIFVYDEDLNEPRQILFGDPEELQNLLLSASINAYTRLEKIIDSKPKTKASLRKAVKKTQNPKLKLNALGAYENTTLFIDYEVKED